MTLRVPSVPRPAAFLQKHGNGGLVVSIRKAQRSGVQGQTSGERDVGGGARQSPLNRWNSVGFDGLRAVRRMSRNGSAMMSVMVPSTIRMANKMAVETGREAACSCPLARLVLSPKRRREIVCGGVERGGITHPLCG